MRKTLILILVFLFPAGLSAHEYLLEAEAFADKGGWVVDQQFMDIMGSSYLLAHGMGTPVDDAITSIVLPDKGAYHIYVRTYNWTSPWYNGEGPGRFPARRERSSVAGRTGCNRKKLDMAICRNGSCRITLHQSVVT